MSHLRSIRRGLEKSQPKKKVIPNKPLCFGHHEVIASGTALSPIELPIVVMLNENIRFFFEFNLDGSSPSFGIDRETNCILFKSDLRVQSQIGAKLMMMSTLKPEVEVGYIQLLAEACPVRVIDENGEPVISAVKLNYSFFFVKNEDADLSGFGSSTEVDSLKVVAQAERIVRDKQEQLKGDPEMDTSMTNISLADQVAWLKNENYEMKKRLEALIDHVEYLEDSLDYHLATPVNPDECLSLDQLDAMLNG